MNQRRKVIYLDERFMMCEKSKAKYLSVYIMKKGKVVRHQLEKYEPDDEDDDDDESSDLKTGKAIRNKSHTEYLEPMRKGKIVFDDDDDLVEHNGEKGKWRTIRGRKIFLPKGGDFDRAVRGARAKARPIRYKSTVPKTDNTKLGVLTRRLWKKVKHGHYGTQATFEDLAKELESAADYIAVEDIVDWFIDGGFGVMTKETQYRVATMIEDKAIEHYNFEEKYVYKTEGIATVVDLPYYKFWLNIKSISLNADVAEMLRSTNRSVREHAAKSIRMIGKVLGEQISERNRNRIKRLRITGKSAGTIMGSYLDERSELGIQIPSGEPEQVKFVVIHEIAHSIFERDITHDQKLELLARVRGAGLRGHTKYVQEKYPKGASIPEWLLWLDEFHSEFFAYKYYPAETLMRQGGVPLNTRELQDLRKFREIIEEVLGTDWHMRIEKSIADKETLMSDFAAIGYAKYDVRDPLEYGDLSELFDELANNSEVRNGQRGKMIYISKKVVIPLKWWQ